MYGIVIKTLFLVFSLECFTCDSYTPIVIWHGIVPNVFTTILPLCPALIRVCITSPILFYISMLETLLTRRNQKEKQEGMKSLISKAADSCCNNTITGQMQTHLWNYLPGSHVVSLQIGNSPEEDYKNSILMHPDKQIAIVCDMIKSDPLLTNGYNAIGFSQGSQLLRGVVQRCPQPRMKTLITLAAQHQGLYGLPDCDALSIPPCDYLRQVVNKFVYLGVAQRVLVPATYWHNPLNSRMYKRKSSYLADINNERTINTTYIKNLQTLEKFVMVKHGADEVVQPRESSWFGFYKDGQSKEVESLRESEIYISDRLGLQQMDKDGKLQFLLNSWQHAQFEWPWFRENIVDKYLK